MTHKIGDVVWTARLKHCEFRETCPDCLGTKAVTLLLENGERHKLECKTCYPGGFDPPRGYITKWITIRLDSAPQRRKGSAKGVRLFAPCRMNLIYRTKNGGGSERRR